MRLGIPSEDSGPRLVPLGLLFDFYVKGIEKLLKCPEKVLVQVPIASLVLPKRVLETPGGSW